MDKPVEIRLKNAVASSIKHFTALLRWKDIEKFGLTPESEMGQTALKKRVLSDNGDELINTPKFPKTVQNKKIAEFQKYVERQFEEMLKVLRTKLSFQSVV